MAAWAESLNWRLVRCGGYIAPMRTHPFLTVLAGLVLLPAVGCATSQPTPPMLPETTSQAASPLAADTPSHTVDAVLQARLESLARGFGGDVGIYVRHLRTGAVAEIRADEVYPTASLVKVPILLTLFDQVERGVLDMDARLKYPDTLTYAFTEATDVVGYMSPGDSLPLSQLVFLMLSTSDNLASLWLQALVGGGAAVNEWMASHGFAQTRVNSRTPGRDAARTQFGWGQTTPREMADMFVMIRQGRAVSPRASERMYRSLTKSYWDDDALSQLPPHVVAASKQGFVSRSRSEVLLVNAPSGDYVMAVITKNQQDTSYAWGNEGMRLIRSVARAVYEHFEPADAWRPLPR
jgi:beta-lactamase class A